MTTNVRIRPGRNQFSMENGGEALLTFNTGSGTRGGMIDAFAGSAGMFFSWWLLDTDGTTVLASGENAATPRVLFEAKGNPSHPGHEHLERNTDYTLKLKLNPVDAPGPFGITSDLNQLQQPH